MSDDERDELEQEKLYPHAQDAKANHFLNLISQIESSGGKDTDHPEVNTGIQAGSQAMGQYGLMPNTVKEMAKRSDDPAIKPLMMMDQNELSEQMKNKDLEYQVARQLADKVLSQQNGDEDMAAYAWNHGHNLKPEQIMDRSPASDPYYQKFNLLTQKLKGNK